MQDPEQKLLTTDAAAAYLAISRSSVNRLVRDRKLAPLHLGAAVRFTTDQLDRFIAREQEAAERHAGIIL